ncbi:MAG: alpha/beta fold hydrolase [Candidatus Omnitrophota bacterium]
MIDAENIIFIPGWSFGGGIWQRQRDYFSRRGFRVFCWTWETFCRRRKGMDLSRTTVVAWSLGWFRLIAGGEVFRWRPRMIVGVGCGLRFEAAMIRLIMRRFARDPQGLLCDFVSWMGRRGDISPGQMGLIHKNRIKDRGKLLRDLLFLRDVDLTVDCGKIKIPVLLIAGDKDRICPLSGMRQLQRFLPRAQLRVIAGAGHNPFLTHCREFNRMLLKSGSQKPGDRGQRSEVR